MRLSLCVSGVKDGICWAIPFFQIAFMHYHPEDQSFLKAHLGHAR
jgi:hypothetical protein